MKFELVSYQAVAAAKVLSDLRKSTAGYAEPGLGQEYGAVSLSAPTGSGKTVIAAAVIERMLFGDLESDDEPNPNAIFLWLTDDGSLNEQTRAKMLEASERLKPSQLVMIDESFDQPEFLPGHVYFLNIQKMGVSTTYVNQADGKRKYTIWETVNNTIKKHGGNYYLVVDEAHRGTNTKTKPGAKRTIVQKFIDGEEGLVLPTPVVWGISATPKRFETFIEGSDRVPRKHQVPVADVRESGLIKDVLALSYKGEKQGMEIALVRRAVRELQSMDERWNAYTETEGLPAIYPAMVLQLPAAVKPDYVSKILDACASEWPVLTDAAVAHALESRETEEFGSHRVPYIAPQRIHDKKSVRLVLFKEALTTGWDCPRAEVMLSLRGAKDETYISQLIGRMVRAPLARRVESDELLNRVSLILPGFSADAVEGIKAHMEADPEGPPTKIDIDPEAAYRNDAKDMDVAFACLEAMPSYSAPSTYHRSQVARLHRLAGLLAGDEIIENAITAANEYLIGVLNNERARLANEGHLEAMIAEVETSTLQMEEVAILTTPTGTVGQVELDSDAVDLDGEFASAKTRFKDGLHKTYWAHLVSNDEMDTRDAKVLVVALSKDSDTVDKVERSAADLVRKWQDKCGNQISNLSDDQRAKYQDVRAMAKDPELIHPAPPKKPISMPGDPDIDTYEHHLYAAKNGKFRTNLATWEKHALELEMKRPGFVAWYRNPVGTGRCVRLPYQDGDVWKSVYPDLIVFHKNPGGEVRASIVDPHGQHLADAPGKLRGLAAYAHKHRTDVARVIAVIRDKDDEYRMLDMTDPTIQKAAQKVSSQSQIEDLFKKHGAAYK